ncbi:Glycosyltransferase 28 domain protein [Candidatus Accumulibacter phosphatis]|uniref:Glycosyltransferase 28 domain protein n=2 Tax=Candidatus Accumulibacter TaxID=327159 RepID=C7RU37_ACCRE
MKPLTTGELPATADPQAREGMGNSLMDRKTILFFAEAVTLAHVARPLALIEAPDTSRYHRVFACDPRCQWLLGDFAGEFCPVPSIASDTFLNRLAQGKPVYDTATLEAYVHDDLSLFEKVKPDLVIGDFRLSLSVSARLARIPYLAISNAYWSPYYRVPAYPVPSLPLTRLLPIGLATMLFRLARPLAFALHARPLDQVRRKYGMSSLGHDVRRAYTDADHVLYADLPQFFPTLSLPANHHFIGPIIWKPPVSAPLWWNTLSSERPIAYVTLGSSGQGALLPHVLQALSDLEVTVIAATAGSSLAGAIPANAYVAQYLPGDEASHRASLVVCNGGSPTSQQALAAGVPVIGIAGNLDQFLNMEAITRAGAGLTLRADRFAGTQLRESVKALLSRSEFSESARRVATQFCGLSASDRLTQVLAHHFAQGDITAHSVAGMGGK